MAAYRRVYDSRHLQADCHARTGIISGTLRSVIEYGLSINQFITQPRAKGHFENLYFTRMNISCSKTNGNNRLTNLTNLTMNINSQRIQHDAVGDTWNYTEQNNLWL